MNYIEFGKSISYERMLKNMTQEEMAKKLGTDAACVSRYESGKVSPRANSILRICQILQITPNRLFGIVEESGSMTGNAYQRLAARTISKKLTNGDREFHALHGMVSEIGEIHGLYQKVYQVHEFDITHVKKELGDLLWFIAEYCTANGWELEEIMQMNIDKLKARYPDGFEADKSLHRKEGDI